MRWGAGKCFRHVRGKKKTKTKKPNPHSENPEGRIYFSNLSIAVSGPYQSPKICRKNIIKKKNGGQQQRRADDGERVLPREESRVNKIVNILRQVLES